MMQLISGDPQCRKHPAVGAILERNAQRSRLHLDRANRRLHIIEDHRQRLPLARRLTLDVDELRSMRHWIEYDHKLLGQLHRQDRLLARRQLYRIDRELRETVVQRVGKIDAGTPENLPEIFGLREGIGGVGGDVAYSRIDRKGYLDHLV